MDPSRQHHAGVQRLGSHSKVNESSAVDGPNVLTATAHTDQANISCNTKASMNRKNFNFRPMVTFNVVLKMVQGVESVCLTGEQVPQEALQPLGIFIRISIC